MTQTLRRTFDKVKAQAKLDETGKSYADLARALGLSRQAVGHWFRERGEPDMQQLKTMARELGCHWLELVDENALVVHQEDEAARVEKLRQASPETIAMVDRLLGLTAPK